MILNKRDAEGRFVLSLPRGNKNAPWQGGGAYRFLAISKKRIRILEPTYTSQGSFLR